MLISPCGGAGNYLFDWIGRTGVGTTLGPVCVDGTSSATGLMGGVPGGYRGAGGGSGGGGESTQWQGIYKHPRVHFSFFTPLIRPN